MKIRSGFVSNSSSSSFIIQCSKVPESHEEARDVWFGESKKWIPEIVSEFLFNKLKPIEIDFNKLEELLNKYTFKDFDCDSETEIPKCKEAELIEEFHSNFWYQEKYNNKWHNGFYTPSNVEYFICEKLDVGFESDEYRNIPYQERENMVKEYFALEETDEKFRKFVDISLIDLKSVYPNIENPTFMEAEIEDCSDMGSEVEHNSSYWERFPGYIRFSHH